MSQVNTFTTHCLSTAVAGHAAAVTDNPSGRGEPLVAPMAEISKGPGGVQNAAQGG